MVHGTPRPTPQSLHHRSSSPSFLSTAFFLLFALLAGISFTLPSYLPTLNSRNHASEDSTQKSLQLPKEGPQQPSRTLPPFPYNFRDNLPEWPATRVPMDVWLRESSAASPSQISQMTLDMPSYLFSPPSHFTAPQLGEVVLGTTHILIDAVPHATILVTIASYRDTCARAPSPTCSLAPSTPSGSASRSSNRTPPPTYLAIRQRRRAMTTRCS